MTFLKPYLAIVFLILSFTSAAQVNADSLFSVARDYAFNQKDYPRALATAKTALLSAPAYIDIIVFVGRVHAWMEEADSARQYFNRALRLDSTNADGLVAFSDLEFWEKQYEASLVLAEKGLAAQTAHPGLLFRKGRALHALQRHEHAAITLSQLLKIEPGNSDARRLLEESSNILASNKIDLQYQYLDGGKQFQKPWHMAAIGYTRQGKAGAYAARIYYANRFGESGSQYELEAYPRFSKRFSGYAVLAYSGDETVFPQWRMGASLIASLGKGFELEAGYRRLEFSTTTNIATFAAAKYSGNWLFGARTFIVPTDSITTHATGAYARRYFGRRNDFVGLAITSGISPDERGTNVLFNKVNLLRTFRVEMLGRWSFTMLNSFQYGFAVINQELAGGANTMQWQLSLGYTRRF